MMRCTACASTWAAEWRRIARPSGLSIVTGSTASVSVDPRREVFQLAVDAQRDDGAIGEEGEAVGGIGHVRTIGVTSVKETLQGWLGCKATQLRTRARPARSGADVRVPTTTASVAFGNWRNPMSPV